MKLGRLGQRIGFVFAAALLFIVLTVAFIPDRVILETINSGLAGQGLKLSAAAFRKTVPLGLKGTGWEISSAKGKLVTFERASVGLQLLPLFTGTVLVKAEGTVGAGSLKLTTELSGPGLLKLEIKNLRLEQVPFFTTVAGTRAAGIFGGQAEIRGLKGKADGQVKLEALGVDLRGVKVGETPLPDASYRTVQGLLRISGGVARLESFTLQGDGLYVRLKGQIPQVRPLSVAPLDLTLELMPKPDFLEKQKFIFLLLTKYLDTPGHYQLPIKGTLGKPLLE